MNEREMIMDISVKEFPTRPPELKLFNKWFMICINKGKVGVTRLVPYGMLLRIIEGKRNDILFHMLKQFNFQIMKEKAPKDK